MVKKIMLFITVNLLLGCVQVDDTAFSHVRREGGKTYIVDRTGHRWDITQAESLGFKPERFQYGLGKNAFTPLDDTYLSRDSKDVPQDLRVIGVEDGTYAKAYSVPRLSYHEISNSTLGSEPVAVGY